RLLVDWLGLGPRVLARDGNQPTRRIRADLVVEIGKFTNAIDRLPDPGTPEQQYSLQYLGRQAHGLGGDDDWLAELVIDDPARLRPRDGAHGFELAHERLRNVLQRRRFQPPHAGSLHSGHG